MVTMRPDAVQMVVGGVIVDDLDAPTQVLSARRLGGAPVSAGRWEFPGGKVEPGESPEDALARELHEELGIRVTLGRELVNPAGSSWPITERYTMRLWYVTIAEGTPEALVAHDDVRWLDRDTVHEVEWLEADLAVLPYLFG